MSLKARLVLKAHNRTNIIPHYYIQHKNTTRALVQAQHLNTHTQCDEVSSVFVFSNMRVCNVYTVIIFLWEILYNIASTYKDEKDSLAAGADSDLIHD